MEGMRDIIAMHVTNFVPMNKRVMLLQFNASPVNTNIIQVYAPTSVQSEEEVADFYFQVPFCEMRTLTRCYYMEWKSGQ